MGNYQENAYQVIKTETWKRNVHCSVFRNALNPQYCVSFDLDITNFHKRVKKEGWSFTFAMVYAAAKCANEIEEFRYRFRDGEVVLYDRIDTSFTYIKDGDDLFSVVNVKMKNSMEEYVEAAREAVAAQKDYFVAPLVNDLFQFSSMPWVNFHYISHTDSGKKDQAVPMFDWGKYKKVHDKLLLPFSVQVHHSFVDGVHIGKLAEKLQTYLNEM